MIWLIGGLALLAVVVALLLWLVSLADPGEDAYRRWKGKR